MADLDIHLMIINETGYTFSGSYSTSTPTNKSVFVNGEVITYIESDSATTDKGLKFPTIHPGQISEIITAHNILERTFRLTCNGTFEDPEDARLDFSTGDPHLGKNSFTMRKLSPFLKLKLRFGNGMPDGTSKWGSPAVPTSGHALGIQMTFTPQPIVNQLSLLTYNTHLFEGSLAESAAKYIDKLIVVADVARQEELVNRIKELGPDIVCLQEVWAKEVQKTLAEELRKIYPHVYIVPDKGSETFFLIDWALDKITNTSGLMVASQFPMQNLHFKMYTSLGKSGDDRWAKKGTLAFSVSFPVSPTKSTTLNIGTTHCPTGIPEAQKAVKTLAGLAFGTGENDGVVAGDFNLHIKKPSEYDELNQTMSQYRAHDLIFDSLPDLESSFTDWTWGNALSIALGSRPKEDNKDRIDYIYFAPGSKFNNLEPIRTEVFHDWKVHNAFDVSDHYPVYVKFGVIAK